MLLVALAVCSASLAAPVPKDPPKERSYYPTALGTKWAYSLEGEKEIAIEVEITEVAVKGGGRTVTLSQTAGEKHRDYPETIRVDAKGVFLLSAADKEIDPPRLDLRPKPTAGDEWEESFTWKGTQYTCATTVGKEEDVTVPAGKFAALPHTQSYGKVMPQVWTGWYAPGVGKVRFRDYEGKVFVLSKYTPGKDK